MKRYGIIGGTGIYSLGEAEEISVSTQYGDVSLDLLRHKDFEVYFITRHGRGHSIPPHKINYKANLTAFKNLGIHHVLATCAVGSVREEYPCSSLALLTDFVDLSYGGDKTFYDTTEEVRHIEMSDPYCCNLRRLLTETAGEEGIDLLNDAIYVNTQGPRFETAAEIRAFNTLGWDLVGMTGARETTLAKELGLCYSSVAIVVNYCTGVIDGPVDDSDISQNFGKNREILTKLFVKTFEKNPSRSQCSCSEPFI